MHKALAIAFFALMGFSIPAEAHAQSSDEVRYEVNLVYPPLAITRAQLDTAETVADLNRHFKSEWVREYLSVEVITYYQGKRMKATSEAGTLSQKQKDILHAVDAGSDVRVNITYIPENTLKVNDPKEDGFTFMVMPDHTAEYPGGLEELLATLQAQAIDQIAGMDLDPRALAAVVFTIDEEGHVSDTQLFQSCDDEEIDELLMETVANMPQWKPAEYRDGTRASQKFALTVGNLESCVIPLLSINQL